MSEKTYHLNEAAFEQFEKLKAREKEIEAEKALAVQTIEARLVTARDATASFLNGVAATLEVPPEYLFIEEYGEFRPNRRRTGKKKAVARGGKGPK